MCETKQEFDHKKIAEANRDFYNRVALDYLEMERYAYTPDLVRNVSSILLHLSENCQGKGSFLDLGCGSGFLTGLVSGNSFFENGTGVDISEEQIRLYNKRFENTSFQGQVSDLCDTGLAKGSFSVAASYSVLHHLFDYFSMLEHVKSLLKKGGFLYCDFEPSRRFQELLSPAIRLRRLLSDRKGGADVQECLAEYHHNIEKGISYKQLGRWLESNGFDQIRIGRRYPAVAIRPILKLLSGVSNSFVPYFYFIARKK